MDETKNANVFFYAKKIAPELLAHKMEKIQSVNVIHDSSSTDTVPTPSTTEPGKVVFTIAEGTEIGRTDREIVTLRKLDNMKIGFHTQQNTHDCGPCLILNALEVLKNGKGSVKSIEEMRKKIKVGDNTWFSDTSVESVLRGEGLNVDRYNIPYYPNLRARIDQAVQQRRSIFVFSGVTPNNHFYGYFLNQGKNVWLMDSFKNAPILSSVDEMKGFLEKLTRENIPEKARNASVTVVEKKSYI